MASTRRAPSSRCLDPRADWQPRQRRTASRDCSCEREPSDLVFANCERRDQPGATSPMSNTMLDAPRVEIEVVRPAAHIPGCQLAPNHLSLDADEHKFGSRGHVREPARPVASSRVGQPAATGTMVPAQVARTRSRGVRSASALVEARARSKIQSCSPGRLPCTCACARQTPGRARLDSAARALARRKALDTPSPI